MRNMFKLLWVCVVLTLEIVFLSLVEVFLAIGICVVFGLVAPPLFYMWTLSMVIYFILVVTGVLRA